WRTGVPWRGCRRHLHGRHRRARAPGPRPTARTARAGLSRMRWSSRPGYARMRVGACMLAGLLAALVTGCARTPEAGAVTTIRFWAMGREAEVVAGLIPEFEREHPGLRIELQAIPWSAAHEKLLTAYAAEAMPDLLQLGNTW